MLRVWVKKNCEAYLEERASDNHLRYTAPVVILARLLWDGTIDNGYLE
jgi:hypothetical protein